jgi:hypothetical protein
MAVIRRIKQQVVPDPISIVMILFAVALLAAVGGMALNTLAARQIDSLTLNTDASLTQNRASVPGDSRLFQAVTAPAVFGDQRFIPPIPGGAAFLSALYLTDTHVVVYDINPSSGQGVLAISITYADIATFLQQAARTGTVTLIANGFHSQLFALPTGQCQLNSIYPDGKPNGFTFDCARTATP